MLEMIQETLTVDAIMTGREDLIVWPPRRNEAQLQEVVRKNEINQIPVVSSEREIQGLAITHGPERTLPKRDEAVRVSPNWLVSADTSIRQLIDIFDGDQHPARFILSGNRITGLVTYADLNKSAARTSLYLLISRLEIQLGRLLRQHSRDSWEYVEQLSSKRQRDFAQLRDKMTDQDVSIDPIEHFNLSDLFRTVRKEPELYETLDFPSGNQFENAKSGVNELRNSVAHSVRLMVEDVEGVGKVNRRCQRIEELLQRLSPSY
jgi:hypothetical protein